MQTTRRTFAHLVLLTAIASAAACDEPAASLTEAPPPATDEATTPATPPIGVDMALAPLAIVDTLPDEGAQAVELSGDLRIGFSRPMDTASTLAAISYSPPIDCTAHVDGALYTCLHPALLPSTTYVVTILGSARERTGASLGADHSFTFTTAPATVGDVTIAGAPGRQVRQGAGDITLTVGGSGLAGVTAAHLGSLAATLVSTSDAQVVLKVSLPHGQPLGGLELSLDTPQGVLHMSDAVVVTEIHAAASLGDDTAAGTTTAPFKTLTRALGVAGAGDTIKLADGTYSAGETWPMSSPNVPAGVKIEGSSITGTILTPVSGAADGVNGLVFAGDAEVSRLQIHGFYRGALAAGAGTVGLGDVRIWGNRSDGVLLSGAAHLLSTSLECDGNSGAGVRVSDNAYFSAIFDKLHHNAVGLSASGNAQVEVIGSAIDHNGGAAAAAQSGVALTGNATARLSAVITDNATAGVYAETTGTVDISGDIERNGSASGCANNFLCSGVVLTAAATAQVQGTISNNRMYGLVTNGRHTNVTVSAAKLSNNGAANATFADPDTTSGFTQVTLVNTEFSGGPSGIVWGDRVMLTMRGGRLANHSYADLRNCVQSIGWTNRFINVGVGAAAQPYPSSGSLVLNTAVGAVAGGPSWWISSPASTGGPGSISFVRQ